jgi:hypothetical protein
MRMPFANSYRGREGGEKEWGYEVTGEKVSQGSSSERRK